MNNKGKDHFAISVDVWLFDARCDGGANNFEIQVHPDFTKADAESAAEKYGTAAGRLPKVLRSGIGAATGIRMLSIYKGRHNWHASSALGGISIYTGGKTDNYEEVLVHEAVHASLDRKIESDRKWKAAQKADGAFVSPYAEMYPKREDVAESFLAWLAARFRPSKISPAWETAILETIPNRIAYFDALLSADDMKPFTAPVPVAVHSEVAADNPVSLSVSDKGAVAEGGSALTITATLGVANETGAALAIPLRVRAADTTATAGVDYIMADTIIIPDGANGGTTALEVVDDSENEPGETVVVELGSPLPSGVAAGAADHVTIAITDNDAKPAEPTASAVSVSLAVARVSVAAERVSVAEDNGEVKFTIALNRALEAGETAVVPFTVTGGRAGRDWDIRFRPKDNGPGVKRTAAGRNSAVTFTEGGQVATLVLIARPNRDTEERTIRIAFGTGDRAPVATGVAGGIAPVGDALSVVIVDDDAAVAPALWVKDERARESAGAMRFTVRLTAPATKVVRVRARTRNARPVSARAKRDYKPVRVDLRFRPGETKKHVRVVLFDDGHDEDREIFELVLSNAEGAVIADKVAVGTIVNDDPLPAAYLARFGRTVAEQALDGIAGRMAASRAPGMQGSIAGQSLNFDPSASGQPATGESTMIGATPGASGIPPANRGAALAMADAARGFGASAPAGSDGMAGSFGDRFGDAGFGAPSPRSRGMTARELLLGSGFSLTGQDGAGGSLAFWGRASQGSFDGAERGDGTDITLDGAVTTGMLGADYARGNWLVGLALTQSTADGGYAAEGDHVAGSELGCPPDAQGQAQVLCDGAVRAGDGDVEASLTAAIPWAALQASERLRLWGAAGYGAGEVTLKTAMGGTYSADTSWSMAAAGVRGDLLEAPKEGSGPALALTSDALWTRTSSDGTADLAASDSDATRLRLGLEGSWRVALEGGGSLTPKLEIGARHDGGDAETGSGVEVGGGIAWVDSGRGLSLDVSGRTLLAHENDDLEDRGFAAALSWDPRPATRRGLSLSLRQEFGGQATGGLDALFAPAPLEERTGSAAASRWAMEAAYGLPAFGGRFVGSPHAGLGLSTGARDWSVGWRVTPEAATAPDLSFGLRATRRESDAADPEHTVGFEVRATW